MQTTQLLIFTMVLIFIGLNLSANNTLHSLILHYIFYEDTISSNVTRIVGLIVLGSSLLVLANATDIAIMVNIFCIFTFVFFLIRGRSKSLSVQASKRQELLKQYETELAEKRQHLESLKQELSGDHSNETAEPVIGAGKSVEDIKKQMWNDGSMTGKEIIENFTKAHEASKK